MNPATVDFAKQYAPAKQKQSFECDKQQHTGALYSPCGKLLVAGSFSGAVLRWDVSGETPRTLEPLSGHHGWVGAVRFAPQGKLAYSGDSWGCLQAWDYAAEKPQPAWKVEAAHDGWLRALAVSPDGKQIATCGRDQAIRLWDAATGKKLREFTALPDDVYVLAFHPDGKSLVAGDVKGIIKHWDLAAGKPTRQFDAKALFVMNRLQDVGGVRSLAFDGEGKTLVAGGTQPKNGGNVQGTPTILFFDWASGKQSGSMTPGATSDVYVCDLAYDPRGFFLAGMSGNPGTGKLLLFKQGDKEPFYSQAMGNCHRVSVHPQGHRIAATGINPNNQGNGRGKGMGPMDYPGNYSPITFFDFAPEPAKS